MTRFVIRRLFALFLVVVAGTVLMFVITHLAPGDPTLLLVESSQAKKYDMTAVRSAGAQSGQVVTGGTQAIQDIRQRWGLDKPLHVQLWIYLKNIFRFDFGTSILTQRSVASDIGRYLPATLELTLIGVFGAAVIGIISALVSVVYKGRVIDHVTRVVSLLGVASPAFVLALLLLLVFYLNLRWFPSGGRIAAGIAPPRTITGLYLVDSLLTGNWVAFQSSFVHLVLPSFAIMFGGIGRVTRIARASLLNVAKQDFVTVGRAKGLPELVVLRRYTLRNALIPIIATLGVTFGYLMGGSILTETVFSWPGMGRYIVQSAITLDYKAVTGCALVITFIYGLVNLLADISYAYVDPRIVYD
ncbi:MAG: ABC transporter permease [Candidatus Bipolaricaulis sp.]|nr:ABC transporter permease [Candidatus Bipolaricaulis sp.]MDD5219984.1 ABC transporter permease [Candidatus Bipolaricaulis sp.]